MARKKELSNDIKLFIVKPLKSEISQRFFQRLLKLSECHSRNDVRNLPRSSRSQATSSRQDRKLVNLTKSMRRCMSEQLNAEWSKYGVKVCAHIVRNRLNDKGYHSCKTKTKPFMTQQHKKSRLEWCKKQIVVF